MERIAQVSDYLFQALEALSKKFPNQMKTLRGQNFGTFIAFDCENSTKRNDFLLMMRANGVNIGGCGDISARLRPTLVFEKNMRMCFGAMESALKAM